MCFEQAQAYVLQCYSSECLWPMKYWNMLQFYISTLRWTDISADNSSKSGVLLQWIRIQSGRNTCGISCKRVMINDVGVWDSEDCHDVGAFRWSKLSSQKLRKRKSFSPTHQNHHEFDCVKVCDGVNKTKPTLVFKFPAGSYFMSFVADIGSWQGFSDIWALKGKYMSFLVKLYDSEGIAGFICFFFLSVQGMPALPTELNNTLLLVFLILLSDRYLPVSSCL